jgi:hypothetical protein
VGIRAILVFSTTDKSVFFKLGFVVSSLLGFVYSWSHIETATIEKFGFAEATRPTEVLSVAEIGG